MERVEPIVRDRPQANLERVGSIPPGTVDIFIPRRVLDELARHALGDVSCEIGGVLVGEACTDADGLWVSVEGYIIAPSDARSAASFRFTAEAWSAIARERSARFGGRGLVGWHHSHPGWGVFLSPQDDFIHRNFFNLPWMIAMVSDPVRGEFGMFLWRGAALEPAGFYVRD